MSMYLCMLQSSIDAAFWSELGTLKLEKLRLSEEAQQITGPACALTCSILLLSPWRSS